MRPAAETLRSWVVWLLLFAYHAPFPPISNEIAPAGGKPVNPKNSVKLKLQPYEQVIRKPSPTHHSTLDVARRGNARILRGLHSHS